MKQVSMKNDELEQYSRRSCLRISGIPESGDEDVPKLVLELANRVGADIRPCDKDRAHQVGKVKPSEITGTGGVRARSTQHNGREIIAKFQNYNSRLKLLKGRAVLREVKERIFINEDLTQNRKSLSYECRQLKR